LDSFEHFEADGIRFADHIAATDFSEAARPHLALVDDSCLRRDCLRLALAQQPGRWRISDAGSAIELADGRDRDFDVVLLGASSCAQIVLGDVALLAGVAPVLVCAECGDSRRARLILDAGARGFFPARLGLGVLRAALEQVRTGGRYVPAMPKEQPAPDDVCCGLTRRQREVLALISEGKPNKLIAEALTMSEDTVKAHVKQIIRRLNVANRTQAALLAAGANQNRLSVVSV
jgi:DNA-binding NarL/FixJ family response regulator